MAERGLRERALRAAMELITQRGALTLPMEEIAAQASTTKMGLYRVFGSKEELVLSALRQFDQEARCAWDALIQSSPPDPIERMCALIGAAADAVAKGERGCPLGNAAAEFTDSAHPARAIICGHKRALQQRLMELAREAGARDPQELGRMLALIVEGISAAAAAGQGPEVARCARPAALALIQGYLAQGASDPA